jgi:acetolactate synthase-1/2/3 large subunit
MRRPWRARLARLRVPVFTTVAAKGAVDERLDWSAGVFTGDGKALAPETQVIARSDLVIGIGLRNGEVLSAKPFGRATALIDEVDRGHGDGFAAETTHLCATAADVDLVLEAAERKQWGADEVRAAVTKMRGALCDGSWLPAACFALIDRLDQTLPHALVLDTGSFCTIGEHLWNAGPDRTFFGSSNARSMGVGIPTAIGVAAWQPGRPVVAVVGDGGVRMYSAEMKLAVDRRFPVAVLFMTDGQYGSIACVPQTPPVAPRLVQVPGPSWWRAMEAMGCESRPVASAADVETALARWDRKGPLFLEATFEATAYGAMTNDLR